MNLSYKLSAPQLPLDTQLVEYSVSTRITSEFDAVFTEAAWLGPMA
eukprot:SAG31_NODE_1173_length_9543_cov_8.654913_9_plen_45_part_01